MKVTSDDIVEGVWVQQYLCKIHGKFREPPTFLLPRLRYVAAVVESAVEARVAGKTMKALCDRWGLWNPTTPGRWLAGVMRKLGQIGNGAQRRLASLTGRFQTRKGWFLAEVWAVLGELQQAWTNRGYARRPRMYHALTL